MESAIYIVATPIGNLSDITIRALAVLSGVDFIAAEDTRHTRKLLEHHGIESKLISYHEHNEAEKAPSLVEMVFQGKSMALVSDAGTPLISDPGHTLVSLAKERGVKVVPIPGPSALIAALSASGIGCGRFIFEGFLPVKQKAKRDCFERVKYEERAIVFYESPHRIIDTLELIGEVMPDREMVIARELTKRYETIVSGNAGQLLDNMLKDTDQQKGEFVLVLSGEKSISERAGFAEQERLLQLLIGQMPPKKAVQVVSEFFCGNKKMLYERAIALKNLQS